MFSHPCDAAGPATAGFKVVTIMPDKDGYADIDAFKAALSRRTAAIFITNPEDTGIYNPRIDEFVKAAHEAGRALLLRPGERQRDARHHQSERRRVRPVPLQPPQDVLHPPRQHGRRSGRARLHERPGQVPALSRRSSSTRRRDGTISITARPESIGKVRSFMGNTQSLVKAYSWIMQHGAEGLLETAVCSVLNNNYMLKKLSEIPGVTIRYAPGKRRLEQVRYSWEKLRNDTGVGTEDVMRRMADLRPPALLDEPPPVGRA